MTEFKSKPRRKDNNDLGALIKQLKPRGGPRKLSLTRKVSNVKEPTQDMKAVEQVRAKESQEPKHVGDAGFSTNCKLRTKQGLFKDYVLKLQGGNLILSRPKSTKQPLLVYPLGQFDCLPVTQSPESIALSADETQASEQDCQTLVLTLIGSVQRHIFFDSSEELFDCLLQVRQYKTDQGYALLSEYIQLNLLGEGGFGKVILAEHKATQLKVAIKLVDKKHLEKTFSTCNETPQEVELLKEVTTSRCRNTLQLIDYSEDQDNHVIVTQYMPGLSLYDHVLEHGVFPLSETRVSDIIRQIAEGIQDLHRLRIVHRDIKLGNILMSDQSAQAQACIADFGSATKLRSPTDTLTWRIGTKGSIAPEIILGNPYSYGVDVWSLGCLMHCLLFATYPFQEKKQSQSDQEWKVCHENFSLGATPGAESLSQECKDLLCSMLVKDPAKRLTIDQVVEHSWLN